MSNLMDNIPYNVIASCNGNGCDIVQQLQQASQDPKAFEENFKKTNPQAYQQALQIRNSANPKELILKLAQQKGLNPNVLKMLGLH